MRHLILPIAVAIVIASLFASCGQSDNFSDESGRRANGLSPTSNPESTTASGLILSDRRVFAPEIVDWLTLPTQVASIATNRYDRWLSPGDEAMPITLVRGENFYGPVNPVPWDNGYIVSRFPSDFLLSVDTGLLIFEGSFFASDFLAMEADGNYVVDIEFDPLSKSGVVEESLFLKSSERFWQQGRATFTSSVYFRSGSIVVVNTLWISYDHWLWEEQSDMLIQMLYDLSQQAALNMEGITTGG